MENTEVMADAANRRANSTIARLSLPLALSSLGEFALESVSYIWVVATLGADNPLSSLFVGALVVASTVPRLVFSPYAGAFADTRGARWALVTADAARFLIVLAFVVVVAASGMQDVSAAVVLVLTCLAVAAASQLLPPARAVAVRAGVAPELRPRASSVTLAVMTASSLASGGLAPLAFALWGLNTTLLVVSFTFIAGAVASWLLVTGGIASSASVTSTGVKQSIHQGIWSAMKSAAAIPVLRMLMSGVAVYGLALGMTNSSLPLFLMGSVGLTPQEYGWVNAAFALGSFIGLLCAPALVRRTSVSVVYVASLSSLGLSYLFLCAAFNVATAFALMTLCGATFAAFSVTQGPIIQNSSPEGMTGRITGLMGPLIAMSSIAGVVLVSVVLQVVEALGLDILLTYRAIVGLAGIAIIIGGLVMFRRHASQEPRTKGTP